MLIVRKGAEEDIRSAYEWYEEKQIDLGTDFVEEVGSTLQKIEEHPDLYMEVREHYAFVPTRSENLT